MKEYKGFVREIYEYEIPIEAENSAEAITKLKEFYNDDTGKNDGIFLAYAYTLLRSEFSLRRGKPN